MTDHPFTRLTWRGWASYMAHAYKAVAKQHHAWMTPVFRRLAGTDGVVFDVGAQAGQYAKLLARIASEGRVYAFEPGGYACSILRLAARVNGLKNVTVRHQGLGDQLGTLTLTTPLKAGGTVRFGLASMGGGTDGAADGEGDGSVHREEVAVTTIDAVTGDEGLARLDFIKMDVEGWEMRVLEGGRETIARHRPAMLIELVDAQLACAGDSLAAAWGLLTSWGYAPYLLATDGDTLRPLEAPLESDVFWLPASAG